MKATYTIQYVETDLGMIPSFIWSTDEGVLIAVDPRLCDPQNRELLSGLARAWGVIVERIKADYTMMYRIPGIALRVINPEAPYTTTRTFEDVRMVDDWVRNQMRAWSDLWVQYEYSHRITNTLINGSIFAAGEALGELYTLLNKHHPGQERAVFEALEQEMVAV